MLPGVSFAGKSLRRRRERLNVRWLLLLIFVAGYSSTFPYLERYLLEYSVFTGFSIIVCSVMLWRLNRPLQVTLPLWIILSVFVCAYYIKFYLITLFHEVGTGLFPFRTDMFFSSPNALASAYATVTYAFAGFCMTAWCVLEISSNGQAQTVSRKMASALRVSAGKYRFVSSVALMIALFLIPVTTFIMYTTGIAVMGVEGVSVPFRLAGLIFYTRSVFVPAMLLLLIWCSLQAGLRKRTAVGLILLVLYGLSDMVLRSSRGALVSMLLPLGFLFLASGRRLHKRYLLFFAGSLLLASFLYPIISVYRNLRIHDLSGDIVSLLASAQHDVIGGELLALWGTLRQGIESFLLRLIGSDMLIVYHGLDVEPLGDHAGYILTSPGGLAGYVTVDLFGFPPTAINAVAPSLVGWFYLIGGNELAVVGLAGFTLVAYSLWTMLIRIRLHSMPVAQALFLSLLFTVAIDGTLDSLVALPTLAWPASIAVCEWLVRSGAGRK